MPRRPGEIGKRRREEIIGAAVAIIAEQGIQHLSLSAIEQCADLSRGQLTYYFPAKEDIMVAVFDRLIDMMRRREGADPPPACLTIAKEGWDRLHQFLCFFILQPPEVPEFHALQYTFLSQIGHREDFRERLANLYESWREHMTEDLRGEMPGSPPVSPRTLATLIQALLHGLAIQRVADPASYDREEMLTLVLHLLEGFLGKSPSTPNNGEPAPGSRDGTGVNTHGR